MAAEKKLQEAIPKYRRDLAFSIYPSSCFVRDFGEDRSDSLYCCDLAEALTYIAYGRCIDSYLFREEIAVVLGQQALYKPDSNLFQSWNEERLGDTYYNPDLYEKRMAGTIPYEVRKTPIDQSYWEAACGALCAALAFGKLKIHGVNTELGRREEIPALLFHDVVDFDPCYNRLIINFSSDYKEPIEYDENIPVRRPTDSQSNWAEIELFMADVVTHFTKPIYLRNPENIVTKKAARTRPAIYAAKRAFKKLYPEGDYPLSVDKRVMLELTKLNVSVSDDKAREALRELRDGLD